MITYESLKELAHALSKLTENRYVTFELFDSLAYFYGIEGIRVNASNEVFNWIPNKPDPGFYHWEGLPSFSFLFEVDEKPDIDWSKCQFDCKEADNEEEN